jgi:hypothetical protein
MTEPINLLTIEEPQIRMMVKDHRILEILPCLKGPGTTLDRLTKGHKDCPKCIKKLRAERASAIRTALQCIQGARGSTLAKLKAALNARQLRVIIAGADGKLKKVTL